MLTRRQKLARIALPIYLVAIYATLGVMRGITTWLREHELLRLTVGLLFAAAALAVCVVVARTPALRSIRAALTLAICAAAYGLVIWPMESIEEKVHFLEYGLVAVLALEAAPSHWRTPVRFAAVALFVAAAGWADEGMQLLLTYLGWANRQYDLRDVAFNAAAGVMALTTLALLRWTAATPQASPARAEVRASPD